MAQRQDALHHEGAAYRTIDNVIAGVIDVTNMSQAEERIGSLTHDLRNRIEHLRFNSFSSRFGLGTPRSRRLVHTFAGHGSARMIATSS